MFPAFKESAMQDQDAPKLPPAAYQDWSKVLSGEMSYDEWMNTEIHTHERPVPPTLEQRVSAAVWFLAHLPGGNISKASAQALMSPQTRYTRLGLMKSSVRLVTDVLVAALQAAPPEQIAQIQTALEQCQQQWAPRPK
jgi:hypothetical protein